MIPPKINELKDKGENCGSQNAGYADRKNQFSENGTEAEVENCKQPVIESIYNDCANGPENEQSEAAHIPISLIFAASPQKSSFRRISTMDFIRM